MSYPRYRRNEYIAAAAHCRVDFGEPASLELQGPGGVYPSLAGQKAVARAFVESLTS